MVTQSKARNRRGRMTTATVSTRHRAARKGLGAHLRYRFDNALSQGPFVVIAYLAALSAVVVLVVAIVATLAGMTFGGAKGSTFGEELWQSMLRTLDSGTFAADSPWPTRVLALLVTLGGIFLAGSLIGLISNAVDQRVEELRRGRSGVIEADHTLILGWSDQVPRIITELVIANESEKDPSIVVLARAEKTLMDETIRERVPDRRNTRVVCRSGDPAVPEDLERACVGEARSIVVVADDDGDAGVVKAILAVRTSDPTLARCHIVAELEDRDNARTLETVCNGRVLAVASDDVVAEVTAQACQQPGLASVFVELLDFDGDEIYFHEEPRLVGRPYRDALVGFDTCAVIGVLRADSNVELNPEPTTLIGDGDQLVLIAEDDSAIAFTGVREIAAPASEAVAHAPAPVNALVIGWSSFGRKVLTELDEFLPDGSRIDVLLDGDLVDPSALDGIELLHATLGVRTGSGGPEDLLALGDGEPYDQVVVLAYRDSLTTDLADARTLLTLLTLRMVWPVDRDPHVRIVAELLDQRNVAIAAPVGVDDLIVSDALGSLMMAQLAERAELKSVFDDLFDATGAVVELRAASSILGGGAEPVSFGTVVAAAAVQGMSAFGYRAGSHAPVIVNPSKQEVVTLAPDDQILVVASRD